MTDVGQYIEKHRREIQEQTTSVSRYRSRVQATPRRTSARPSEAPAPSTGAAAAGPVPGKGSRMVLPGKAMEEAGSCNTSRNLGVQRSTPLYKKGHVEKS